MSDLYDSDILVWSEQQAALLRRLATGERITHEVDWENVVEEIESVGRNDLHAVNSYLALTLLQMLKPRGWPNAPYVPHWQGEARRFRGEAIDRCSPSLRQRLDRRAAAPAVATKLPGLARRAAARRVIARSAGVPSPARPPLFLL